MRRVRSPAGTFSLVVDFPPVCKPGPSSVRRGLLKHRSRFTRPKPWCGSERTPEGAVLGSRSAPAISKAFISAADGLVIPRFLRKNSRTRPTAPAVSGVAMLVPPMKKYFLFGGYAFQAKLFGASLVDRVDKMNVPGASTSGFMRPSFVGPRLLNATTWSALLAMGSSWMGFFGKSSFHHPP